ncbi:MAG: ATP-dependent 6-phosphofructokinase [Kiritimatiellae bacterium]|nr:ATP-dependent 6-phosphofructokinase [Kiritimatiellia bacterium]MDD4734479.1 ATP-dependent 6-phosphofructokinase [Kiritimatiellia bacterium]
MITPEQFIVKNLGVCTVRSPLPLSIRHGDGVGNFTPDNAKISYQNEFNTGIPPYEGIFFEKAGSREMIYFDPQQITAAVVTCGGLCPGLNNVIRSVVRQFRKYGVKKVLGIRYGFQGLNPNEGLPPIDMEDEMVEDIHREGGTMLGSSRGPEDVSVMVDFMMARRIRILICIGGDGTLRGARDLANEVERRGAEIAIVGIPKTIDNDIMYISRSFGFSTAIEQAKAVLDCAHAEAKGAPNGIGLVKVMGRESGFIAVHATLASQEVNFTLIPEVPFNLEGEGGFLPLLKARLQRKRHAVVVVAEGAALNLMPESSLGVDASGNKRHPDVGIFLKEEIQAYFKREKMPVNLKYIDPSYIIRSVPANTGDALLCDQLARRAVDAGMAGKTQILIGMWDGSFVHLPIPLAVAAKKKVEPEGEEWIGVYEATGQPLRFIPEGQPVESNPA